MNLTLSLALFLASQQPAAPSKEQRIIADVIRLTNIQRTQAGQPELKSQPDLAKAAAYLAADLAKRQVLEHRDGEGRRLQARVESAGYTTWTTIAENIAYGQQTADEVVKAWMKSPGHKENLLGSTYTEIGVGLAYSSNRTPYWVQIFGSRTSGNLAASLVRTSRSKRRQGCGERAGAAHPRRT